MKYILYNNIGSVIFDGDTIEQNEHQLYDDSSTIVVDRNDIDFKYTKLPNCYFIDVYKYLRCKKLAMSHNEFIYPTEFDIKQFILKTDHYIQEITLKREDDLYKNGFVLFEQIVANYCCKEVKPLDNWMYVAKHCGSIRIIVGVGQCVVLSRFLSFDTDIIREVANTLFYLRRFGIGNDIKIIADENVYQVIHCEFKCRNLHKIPTLNADYWLIKTIMNSSHRMRKVFYKKNIADLFNKKTLITVLCILLLMVSHILSENSILSRGLQIEKNIKVKLKSSCNGLEAELDVKNFEFIKEFALCLAKADSRICKLREIYNFCKNNDVVIHRISICEDSVKIQTKLSKDKIENLIKKYSYINIKMPDSNDDALFQDMELDVCLEIK